jgi:hypothetical protein
MKLAQDHIHIMAICCEDDEWMKLAQDNISIMANAVMMMMSG